jgi:hypothetical protein
MYQSIRCNESEDLKLPQYRRENFKSCTVRFLNCDRAVLENKKSELRFNRDGNMNTETEGLSNQNVHTLIVVPNKQPTRIEINRRVVQVTALSRATECASGPSGLKKKVFIVTENREMY